MAGIAKAKGRRSSKHKNSGLNNRQKAGLPAKAGRRRPHNIIKDTSGNYIAAPFKERPKTEEVPDRQFIMTHSVGENDPRKVNFNLFK